MKSHHPHFWLVIVGLFYKKESPRLDKLLEGDLAGVVRVWHMCGPIYVYTILLPSPIFFISNEILHFLSPAWVPFCNQQHRPLLCPCRTSCFHPVLVQCMDQIHWIWTSSPFHTAVMPSALQKQLFGAPEAPKNLGIEVCFTVIYKDCQRD